MTEGGEWHPGGVDAMWLGFQFGTVVLVLLVLFGTGLPFGTLEPLLFVSGLGAILVPVQAVAYFVAVLVLVALRFGAGGAADANDTSTAETGSETRQPAAREAGEAIVLLFATAVGGAAGGLFVVGIPDWLSAELPLFAVCAAVPGLVAAGQAVPERRVRTALSTAGATVYLFLLPILLGPVLGILTLVVAAVVGIGTVAVARRVLREAGPLDARLAAPLALVLLVVAGGALAVDLADPRPTVTAETVDAVNLTAAEERRFVYADTTGNFPLVRVGTVTVSNEAPRSRSASLPSYRACLYTAEFGPIRGSGPTTVSVVEPEGRATVVDDPRLDGKETREYAVVVLLDRFDGPPGFDETDAADVRALGTVPVRQAEQCPESTASPALVLVRE
jgi:hypothetical protein